MSAGPNLPQDSAEEEDVTQAGSEEPHQEHLQDSITNRFQHVPVSFSADQWCMMNQIQQMRSLLTSMETIILRQNFTVAHHLALVRWQDSPLGTSLGHPDTQLWHQANIVLRGYAHDHTVFVSSRARSRSRSPITQLSSE